MRALIALPLLLAATPVLAQAYQCRIPQAPLAAPAITPDGPARKATITGYTLALSWSPEFCRVREHSPADRFQCSGQGGRFGFVVHGFWPEGRAGAWPQWCPTTRAPAPETLRQHLCMMPSARLMAHEWAKHGSCLTARPETYFKVTQILWNSLRLPDLDRLSRNKALTAGVLRQRLVDANPGWRADAIGIETSRKGWLREVRLCYAKDFRPGPCDRRRHGPPDSAPLKIWRGI